MSILGDKRNSAIRHYLNFLQAMIIKEVRTRYKRAVLGYFWVLLNPLLQMLLIGFIFSLFIDIPNYYLFILSGLLPWIFFSQSLNQATGSIVNERRLLQKSKLAIETIPLSVVLSNYFNLGISIIFLISFLVITKALIISQLALLIPAILWLLVLVVGLSLLTSAIYVKYRDIAFIVRTLLLLGFYATPIIYNLSMIPERLWPLFALNPLVTIVELFHMSFLNQGVVNGFIFRGNVLMSVVLIFIGILVFVKKHNHFVDWI